MGWDAIIGHADTIRFLRAAIGAGRIANAYLFCGPEGIGKRTVALRFAQALLCEEADAQRTDACGSCISCRLVASGTHPDLILVSRPGDKAFIPIEAFVGVDGKMRDGLCHDLSLKPYRGGRKVAIVDDADFMHQEGANSLLKTLEEPPAGSVLILIATSLARQLPTIRSRCQRVGFQPLSAEEVKAILLRVGDVEDAATAGRLAAASAGSVQQAMILNDPAFWEFRAGWFQQLATGDPSSGGFAKVLGAFVDQAGTDGAAKRDRMRLVSQWAIEYYYRTLHAESGLPLEPADPKLNSTSSPVGAPVAQGAPRLARLLERCVDAHSDVALNLNQALWIDCLLADLGRLGRGEFVDPRYA